MGQVVNFLYSLQGESAGAQAFSNFDTLLSPFIKHDRLSYKSVKQVMQEFIFNMNVPTRVGFQTPFSNITLDVDVPDFMKDEPAIIGGKFKNNSYSEYKPEMDMFNRAFNEIMGNGDAKGRVFTFPIPTVNITEETDWESPAMDDVMKITSKYGTYYFSNFINSDMKPEDARSMCCRLRLSNKELRKRGGGLFGAFPLTGSIGVATINMPRIGYIAKSDTDYFERLDDIMDLAKNSLEIKRKLIEKFTENGLYPYTEYYLRDVKSKSGEFWYNHFSTIGIVGMNESLMNYMGTTIADKDGIKFALKVADHMRDRLKYYQESNGHMYNFEATPAESTSYRLAKLDVKKFKDIFVANEKDRGKNFAPYYTNSTQLPVDQNMDLFDALKLQDKIQTKYTGGTVFHVYMGERIMNHNATKTLVKTIASNYKLPYFTITPTFSVCPNCGYVSGEHHNCPTCNSISEVYSRVVGYLRPVAQWNDGKKAEFGMRSTFDGVTA
jgi:ribonucleoside-triphosphate reductase